MKARSRLTKIISIVIAVLISFSFFKTVSFAKSEDVDWDRFSSRYYYRQMNEAEKELYDALYEKCMEYLTTTKNCEWDDVLGSYYIEPVRYDDSLIDGDDQLFVDVAEIFINSNPQFYFLEMDPYYPTQTDEFGSHFVENYISLEVYEDFADGREREKSTKQFISTVNEYIDIINQEKTDYEKERTAHEIIASRLDYDHDVDNIRNNQSSASAFLTTKSVCAGYSEGLELLLNGVGIECIPVISENNTHEWLQAKIDGVWYAVDVTWDDAGDVYSERYFNVSDETLREADARQSDDKKESHIPAEIYSKYNRPVCEYDYIPEPPEPIEEYEEMFRLYNKNSGEHFYTSDYLEKNFLVSVGWTDEGIAWIAPTYSDTPVFRVYNPNSGEHHYTMKSSEKDFLVGVGWKDEGIGWYSDDNQGTALYRLYNPNATGAQEAGGHHYTKDVNEKNSLIAAGWRDEGIGWYGI